MQQSYYPVNSKNSYVRYWSKNLHAKQLARQTGIFSTDDLLGEKTNILKAGYMEGTYMTGRSTKAFVYLQASFHSIASGHRGLRQGAGMGSFDGKVYCFGLRMQAGAF